MDLNLLKFVNYSFFYCFYFNVCGYNMYFGFLLFLYRDEDIKVLESFIRRCFISLKFGIILLFFEDCLSVDSDDKKFVVSLDMYIFYLYMIFCFKCFWFFIFMVFESCLFFV